MDKNGVGKTKNGDFSVQLNDKSKVQTVIGILSGKGGVGKSSVTAMLAVVLNRLGYRTAILDADITGPSIPRAFGMQEKAQVVDGDFIPVTTKTGIKMMSMNLLLEKDTDPVVWRGPMIGKTVKQFWSQVVWGDVDYLLIDMPPGTGDVPLTVFQSLPVDGILVVTSPQELVGMIVSKAVKMAERMQIPILGLVENMSYFRCPDNQKDYPIFGESHLEEIAAEHGLKVVAKLPVDPQISSACDHGEIEQMQGNWLDAFAEALQKRKDSHENSNGTPQ